MAKTREEVEPSTVVLARGRGPEDLITIQKDLLGFGGSISTYARDFVEAYDRAIEEAEQRGFEKAIDELKKLSQGRIDELRERLSYGS